MDNTHENGPKEPPKINLGLIARDDQAPAKPEAKPVAPEPGSPPKLKIRNVSTESIQEKTPSAAAEIPKIKLNFGTVETPPKAKPKPMPTDKIDTGIAPSPSASEAAEPEKPKIKLNLNAETEAEPSAKPDLKTTNAAPPPDKPKAHATPPVQLESETEEKSAVRPPSPKSQTIRLDDIQEDSLEDLYKAALNATQRVILDEQQRASETSRIEAQKADEALKKAEFAESAKKSTARLDLQEMLSDDDKAELLKNQTMPINLNEAPSPKPGGTVKIQRPDMSASADTTMAIQPDLQEPKKSETARIDMPHDAGASTAPPTQRKTIRIKRPDGSAAPVRSLSVARASAGDSKAQTTVASKGNVTMDSDEVPVHGFFAIAAVIAFLVAAAAVYVLAATLFPEMPMPGRLA